MVKYLRLTRGVSSSRVLCFLSPCKTSYLLGVTALFGRYIFVADQTVEFYIGCIAHRGTLPLLPSNPMWKSTDMCINKHATSCFICYESFTFDRSYLKITRVVQKVFQASKNGNNSDPIKVIVLLTEKAWCIFNS
jgi:hypothetical protein